MMSATIPVSGSIHSPLPSNSIRLLQMRDRPSILPVHGTYLFELSIEVFEFQSAPSYNALSYTWGDAHCAYLDENLGLRKSESCSIRCNGVVVPAQQNLLDALVVLWENSEIRHSYIWIDALCINQKDAAEKASQVQLMGRLYAGAATVIVWLGPEDSSTSDAILVAERLSPLGVVPTSTEHFLTLKKRLQQLPVFFWRDEERLASSLGIEPITVRQWLAWVALLHRPYFSRVWIIQEITLANKIFAMCGRMTLDWDKFMAALIFWSMSNLYLEQHPELLNASVKDPADRSGFETLLASKMDSGRSAVGLVFTSGLSRMRRYTLDQLLSNHRFCKATDARDKIYGLLSIARQDRPPFTNNGHARLFVPDYVVPVEMLYTRVARALLESQETLAFLEKRESNEMRSVKTLPSWVPDLSTAQLPTEFGARGIYKASGDLKWRPDGRDYGDPLLNVQGYCLGTIEAHLVSPYNVTESSVWGGYCEVASGIKGYYCTTKTGKAQTPVEALARTCVADVYNGQSPAATEELVPQFLAYAAMRVATGHKWYLDNKGRGLAKKLMPERMHKLMIATLGFSINDPLSMPWKRLFQEEPAGSLFSTESLKASLGRVYEGPTRYQHYEMAANQTIAGRVLFRTGGGLLGMGPSGVQVGDEVWILAGSTTAAVLRRKPKGGQEPDHHEYLGAAYVHQMMHGEVFELGLDLRDVVLV